MIDFKMIAIVVQQQTHLDVYILLYQVNQTLT